LVTPTFADGKIAWKQDGEWLTLQSYVADHMICDLPCSILSCLLRAMKLTGHQKLSHPLKVEFFLRHMGKSDEEIAVALSLLKVRTRKKQDSEAKEEGEQADGEDSSEDEALGEDEDPNIPESLNEMVDAEVSANPHDEANQPEVLEAVFPHDPLPQEEGDQEVEMTDGHAVPEERKERKDKGGLHKPAVPRGDDDVISAENLPPGCSATWGHPQAANPFVQLKLPNGCSYQNKKSRAVSFIDAGGPTFKGTKRSKENAVSCISAWAWTWWDALTADEKSAIRNSMTKRSRDRSASAGSSRSKRIKS